MVIGASAGGVETLVRVVRGLPPDLPAAVCVVLHIAPGSPSALAAILQRAGSLPCRTAVDGEALRDGEILVAPPDRHLTVVDGRVSLTVGPRENGHRPAVDALFRTAAEAKDGSVVGVVLSGTRDDGTAGLAVIKAHGGIAIIQDPDEALYPGMPANALVHVTPDAVVASGDVADAIVRALRGELPPAPSPAPGLHSAVALDNPAPVGNPGHGAGNPGHGAGNPGRQLPDPQNPDPPEQPAHPGTDADRGDPASAPERAAGDHPVTTTCPECGGVLDERREAGVTQWQCKVGHRYSPESLADAQAEGVEAALWAAVRALEDRQALLERMARQLAARGNPRSARSFRRRAREAAEQADVVRGALRRAATTTLERISENGTIGSEERETA